MRWNAALADPGRMSFGYVDTDGEIHDAWPPKLGLTEGLPAAVLLRRGTAAGGPRSLPLVASVQGSLKPVVIVYELEQD